MNDNIIQTLVDCSIDTMIILCKQSKPFFKWLLDGWIDLDKPNWDIFFTETKLYNSNKKNKPILKKVNHSVNNDVYIFTIPTGLSILDFTKRKEQIAQFLHIDLQHIKIENINNMAAITVCRKGYIEYNYEDYKFKPSLELRIPLGINLNSYNVEYWNPCSPNETNMIIAGNIGSGKSVALSVIISYLIEHREDIELYLQDTKMVDMYDYRDCKQVIQYNQGKDYAEETISLIIDEMDKRYEYLKEKNKKNVNQLKPKDRPKYIFYIVEELASFDPKEDKEYFKMLGLLVSKCRAAGINVIITSQSIYHTLLQGEIKNNFNTVIGLKVKTQEVSKVICGDYDALVNLRGRGHAKVFGVNEPVEIQCFNIQEDTVNKIVKNNLR